LRLSSTSLSATTSAGTRCRTTIAIHTPVITVTTIAGQDMAAATVVVEVTVAAEVVVAVVAVATIETTTTTARHGVV
jgi:hypothetical protein